MSSVMNNAPPYAAFGLDSDFSDIQVDIIPEKKGVFIKHVEYEVKSGKFTVTRRYNDFGVLDEILHLYFQNRTIPRLPPKKAITHQAFLDERRKALGRYLSILNRHPSIRENAVYRHFLSYVGSDVAGSLRSLHKGGSDEFSAAPLVEYEHVKVSDWTEKLVTWKNNMASVEKGILKLIVTMEMVCQTNKDHVRNYMALNLDLNNLCESAASPFLDFLTHQNAIMRNPGTDAIADVATEIAGVTKQWLELTNAEESGSFECLLLMKDLLKGWKDMFRRQDKNASADQKALNKVPSAGKNSPTKMDERASNVATAENRLRFGLHCVQQEMDFLQTSLAPLMTSFMKSFVKVEKFYSAKIAVAWEDVNSVLIGQSQPPPATPTAPAFNAQ